MGNMALTAGELTSHRVIQSLANDSVEVPCTVDDRLSIHDLSNLDSMYFNPYCTSDSYTNSNIPDSFDVIFRPKLVLIVQSIMNTTM